MNYHLIIPLTVSAKKGDTQQARFGVTMSRPYPRITTHGLDNLDNLDPNEYRNRDGVRLADSYHVFQLSPSYSPETHKGDRTDHAGYDGNGGALQFRGKDLGELVGRAELRPKGNYTSYITWRGGFPTSTVAWLDEQVGAPILAAIRANRASIRARTISELVTHGEEMAAEALQNIAECSKAYQGIIDALRKGEEQ